ncbi:MAG: DUF4215 domain-containing protein [Myxococcales bacterium]|nr:DUF4215 domain-containing protein [Myxococcales bacterium]
MKWSLRVTLAALMFASAAAGQEVPCRAAAGQRCSFDLTSPGVAPIPLRFELQARLSQAQLPVADTTLQNVLVNVLRGQEILCQEAFQAIPVVESVLNLTIGAGMSCPLGRILAENGDLAFQVCVGPGNCLKPLPIGSSPYAISASYASIARQAVRADEAVEALWTRWITADRDMLVRPQITTGLFDFGTPAAADALALFGSSQAFAAAADAGFLLWTPVKDPSARTLHVSAKDPRADRLVPLLELVIAAKEMPLGAMLRVEAPPGSAGLVVHEGEASISGSVEVLGTLTSSGTAVVETGDLTVLGGGLVSTGALAVGGALSSTSGGLFAQGGASITGNVAVGGGLAVSGPITVSSGGLTVSGAASTGPLTALGATNVGGDLVVTGPAVFESFVELNAGSASGPQAADSRYVASPAEARAFRPLASVTLAGPVVASGGLRFNSLPVSGARMPVSPGAPFPCDVAHEGAFTVNSSPGVFEVCIGTVWRRVVMAACGDGRTSGKEQCDDKNRVAGDGCSDACAVENHYACAGQPSVCYECGDGVVDPGEGCDDGGYAAGDGCDPTCQVESGGWTCSGAPSVCKNCGNGKLEPGEVCDTGGAVGCASCTAPDPTYFCSQPCTVTAGYAACASQCYKCGDGVVTRFHTASPEDCDDGNLNPGDGCSSECRVETNWGCAECWNYPSKCMRISSGANYTFTASYTTNPGKQCQVYTGYPGLGLKTYWEAVDVCGASMNQVLPSIHDQATGYRLAGMAFYQSANYGSSCQNFNDFGDPCHLAWLGYSTYNTPGVWADGSSTNDFPAGQIWLGSDTFGQYAALVRFVIYGDGSTSWTQAYSSAEQFGQKYGVICQPRN